MPILVLSVIQFTAIICIYFAIIMAVPSLMFAKRLKGKSLTERFLFCMVAGNFYIIMAVMILALMKIKNRFIMVGIIFGFAIWRYLVTSGVDYKGIVREEFGLFKRVFFGQVGIKTYCLLKINKLWRFIKRIISRVWQHFISHIIEWILFLAVTGFNIWYFTCQTFHFYGYGASDTVVHLQWIENIAKGSIFAAGVYPHGFHCMIYFIYQVTDINLFIIMRYFGAIQAIFIHIMLYCFMKNICRAKYAAFIAYILYSVCQIFDPETMMRYQMTIPQEYGMLFLLPMLIYLSRFMKERKIEVTEIKAYKKAHKGEPKPKIKLMTRVKCKLKSGIHKLTSIVWRIKDKKPFFKNNSTASLVLAAAAFSLTLTVHFYITICAGMLCVGFASAYFPTILNKRYVLRLACAVMAGLFIAIAPMAYAVASGRRLEGSLRWALSIITIGSEATGDIAVQEADEKKDSETTSADKKEDEKTINVDPSSETSDESVEGNNSEVDEKIPIDKNKSTLARCYEAFVPAVMPQEWFVVTLACMIFILLVSGIRLLLFRLDYDKIWITVCMGVFFMFVLFNSAELGIPEFMDKIRARILISYIIPVMYAYVVEFPYIVVLWLFKKFKFTIKIFNTVSLALCLSIGFSIFYFDNVKNQTYFYMLQHNGAVKCLYDIVDNYPTNKWTIVSPVDETRLVWNHGYHYELIELLSKMENWNSSKTITIPTQYVFIFIEKRPLFYSSLQEADKPLSNLYDINEKYAATVFDNYASQSRYYQKVERALVMSKAYYWAAEYKKLFPNEMETYYEDEYFICYKIEQNVYHLNNFAINYGFNVKKEKSE